MVGIGGKGGLLVVGDLVENVELLRGDNVVLWVFISSVFGILEKGTGLVFFRVFGGKVVLIRDGLIELSICSKPGLLI